MKDLKFIVIILRAPLLVACVLWLYDPFRIKAWFWSQARSG